MSFLDSLRKNLTPEQYTQITDALGDDFDFDLVPRSRLNKVIKQRNALREQLAGTAEPQNGGSKSNEEDDDDVDTTETKGGTKPVDIKALEKQWKDAQDKAVQEVKIQFAALEKLRAANAIDAELIWNGNIIDKTKLSLDDKGSLVGLDEIITDLQKNKSHLFTKKDDPKDVPSGTGKNGGEDFKGVTTREEFLKLDADKQFAFKQANPTLFQQFLQG